MLNLSCKGEPKITTHKGPRKAARGLVLEMELTSNSSIRFRIDLLDLMLAMGKTAVSQGTPRHRCKEELIML